MELTAAAFLSNRAADVEGGGGGGGYGIIGGLAHTVDTLYAECSHGAAYSITTPLGLRFNLEQTVAGQARLARALNVADDTTSDAEAAAKAADAVEAFFGRIGMPLRLRAVGVPREGIRQIAEDALDDFGLHRNARPINGAEELAELLESVW